jgi:RNA polymerase sigma factor (sigma-70 family)
MAFFLRRLRNHAEAEDLTQEVFTRLAGADREPMQSAEAYIFRMAANLLSDRGRRERIRAEYRASLWADDALGVDPLDPARVVDGRDDIAKVVSALSALPERTRSIFILYRLENVDKRAMAEALGISVSAIDKHLMRAQAHLTHAVRADR